MPRKSDAAIAAAAAKPAAADVDDRSSPGPQTEDDKPKGKTRGVNIDDNTLPKTTITRLAKGVLPQNTQIQKDAVTAFTRGTMVFVNYLASAANDITQKNGKKTIMPKDVLEALDVIEFPGLKERLEVELQKFTEKQEQKRAKAKARPSIGNTTAADTTTEPMSEDDDAAARPSKRQRKSLAGEGKPGDGDESGDAVEGNILDDGSQDDDEDEREKEGESGSDNDEEDEESGEEDDSGAEDAMQDAVEDIDRDDTMGGDDDDDEALDDDSD
ncbi:hypothetical protein DRE_02123 [Drechslerella stenobrocha 248]|uniref:DNA polymerase epsilon subunit D n=1 Tax=Drechslerella stenobrocha 248 TaxID=1043628 RepID=W7HXV6_9PEZI|nr:hypothetical protein DRE_02123 [Drechslerella stenobrocha 248]